MWCWQELNRRHMDFQSIALPPELQHHSFGIAKVAIFRLNANLFLSFFASACNMSSKSFVCNQFLMSQKYGIFAGMDSEIRYIQVAVPLKLSWNPVYSTVDAGIAVGDRVKVRITGRTVDAVVVATDVVPDIDASRIQPIYDRVQGLPRVTEGELKLWKFISDYYLCTMGEVFKGAYPGGRIESEEAAAVSRQRKEAIRQKRAAEDETRRLRQIARLEERLEKKRQQSDGRHSEAVAQRLQADIASISQRIEALMAAGSSAQPAATIPAAAMQSAAKPASAQPTATIPAAAMQSTAKPASAANLSRPELKPSPKKPALLMGTIEARREAYTSMIAGATGNVLFLCPEIAQAEDVAAWMSGEFPDRQVLTYLSIDTAAHRRRIAEILRDSHAPYILVGTRASVFLPFSDLSLIIVDEEQDPSYKQDSPAPRYHGRDTAIMLAGIHGAAAVLGSATPSMESMHNARTGRYRTETLSETSRTVELEIVDTAAEKRKRGMVGQLSRKLIAAVGQARGRSLIITSWNDTSQLRAETAASIPTAEVCNMREARTTDFGMYSLIAFIQADTILGGDDFRTDEKALQLFDRYRLRCSADGGKFLIQTSRSDHQVFKGLQEGITAYDLLVREREMFGYPPFSRIVDVIIRDESDRRLEYMSGEMLRTLTAAFGSDAVGLQAPVRILGPLKPEDWKEDAATRRTVRLLLKKDRQLQGRKEHIRKCVADFEKDRKYTGHIALDADPI